MSIKLHFTNNYDKYLEAVFFCLIAWFLQDTIAEIDWKNVRKSLWGISSYTLLLCLLFTFISYSIFCVFDYIGARAIKMSTDEPPYIILMAAFVCYAFNFNFGGLLGAVGMRLKLYTDLGFSKKGVAQIGVLSTISNWVGYGLVAGTFFSFINIKFPQEYNLNRIPWTILGYGLLILVVGYIYLIFRVNKFTIFSKSISLPNARDGIIRLALGSINWIATAIILVLIFKNHFNAPLDIVISSFFAAAIAGVVIHIPAGLGVFEAIFLTLLSPQIGNEKVMSGILTFRAIYYFFPLLLGFIIIFWLKMYRIPKLKQGESHV